MNRLFKLSALLELAQKKKRKKNKHVLFIKIQDVCFSDIFCRILSHYKIYVSLVGAHNNLSHHTNNCLNAWWKKDHSKTYVFKM